MYGVLTLAAACSPDAYAQAVSSDRKSVHIVRTQTPPLLDGALDDAAWLEATTFEDLHQYEPEDHGTPTERTVVYLLYHDDNQNSEACGGAHAPSDAVGAASSPRSRRCGG